MFETFHTGYKEYKEFKEKINSGQKKDRKGAEKFTVKFIQQLIDHSKALAVEPSADVFDRKELEDDIEKFNEWKQKVE